MVSLHGCCRIKLIFLSEWPQGQTCLCSFQMSSLHTALFLYVVIVHQQCWTHGMPRQLDGQKPSMCFVASVKRHFFSIRRSFISIRQLLSDSGSHDKLSFDCFSPYPRFAQRNCLNPLVDVFSSLWLTCGFLTQIPVLEFCLSSPYSQDKVTLDLVTGWRVIYIWSTISWRGPFMLGHKWFHV